MNNFFKRDLSRLDSSLRETAEAVYDYCVNVLSAEIHYRKEREVKAGGGQKHTIMRIPTTRTFFLVIDMQKPYRLRLSFPDKNDEFHAWGAEWCSKRQGENGKREKQIDITMPLSKLQIIDLQDKVAAIYENALEYYIRTHDSTKTWQRMFGDPSGKYAPLKAAKLTEEQMKEIYGEGRCSICGMDENLEIGWRKNTPFLFCMRHNRQKSQYCNKALTTIPLEVREYVWHRDQGHGLCGHDKYLQYDHLIPRSKGGSNTENNIILKCRTCNLSKSGKLMP